MDRPFGVYHLDDGQSIKAVTHLDGPAVIEDFQVFFGWGLFSCSVHQEVSDLQEVHPK
ncbi:hypothetical protein PCASD_26383 [Puccinia coronata f. sp. avenae]|uniref:Uncharacterized protein n=1 Tax=Puccinia coronata f. sp. avenae TaxID=200324 RepID=A0A2N5TNY1_9BASI|nr:hypothetical protein PCASD_26383 [Puccinia coronata f. sp. avenae]